MHLTTNSTTNGGRGHMSKARTKAGKRRGRKKVLDVPREPNGRISRSGIHHEPADEVAIMARVRHTGLPRKAASDPKAGTYIGYLSILGRRDGLSEEQYEAACQYLRLHSSHARAIRAPDSTRQQNPLARLVKDEPVANHEFAESLPPVIDQESDEYVDWCNSVRKQFGLCRTAIQEAQNENRSDNLWAAIDYCIIRDEWHSHMLPSLRVACNALARFFKG